MVSSIPGFYLLDASSTSHPTIPSCDNQKCLQTLPNAPGGAKSSSAENYPLTRRMRQEHQSTEDGVTQSVHLIYYGSTELYSLMKSRKRDENTVWTAIIPNNKQIAQGEHWNEKGINTLSVSFSSCVLSQWQHLAVLNGTHCDPEIIHLICTQTKAGVKKKGSQFYWEMVY